MKLDRILTTAASVMLFAVAGAHAQFVAPIQSYLNGYALNGQLYPDAVTWQTNDANDRNFVDYTSLDANNWAGIGGSYHDGPPSVPTADIFINFPLIDTTGTPGHTDGANAEFTTTMMISRSIPAFANRDQFAWKFRTSTANGQTPIVSIDFHPSGTSPNFTWDIWYTDCNGISTDTGIGFAADYAYNLDVKVTDLGGAAPTLSYSIFGPALPTGFPTDTLSYSHSLPAETPIGIGQIAASWTPLPVDGNGNVGSNALYFETYAVTVPEPSVIGLLGLAGLGLAYRQAKRAKAARA